MNCPKCGLINTGNMAVGLAMPQCMCQWQSAQEKSEIQTVPAQGTLLPKREWVGLTDEEVWDMECYKLAMTYQETSWLYRFARAIEAKLKAKNGFPQEEKNG